MSSALKIRPNSRSILYIHNTAQYMVSHRLRIAEAAAKNGYTVHIATPPDERYTSIMENAGCIFHPIILPRAASSFRHEIAALIEIGKLVATIKPTILHLITIKPAIYGGIIGRIFKTPACLYAIAGLRYEDHLATESFLKRKLVELLAKIALNHSNSAIIFQNQHDRDRLVSRGTCELTNTTIIPGSGVDLSLFKKKQSEPRQVPVILLASRMMEAKGIRDFIEAARIINRNTKKASFILAGAPDPDVPGSISENELAAWSSTGIVDWLGYKSDITNLIINSDIICLPSHGGEGVPKFLLEGLAAGKPIVASNVPGCRDVVESGVNGILVPPRAPIELAHALNILIDHAEIRNQMSRASASKFLDEYNIETVITKHLALYDQLCSNVRLPSFEDIARLSIQS